MASWHAKDPDEVLDYDFDWTGRLKGDVINSSVWLQVDGSDGLLVIDSDEFTTAATKVWLSGGTLGQVYQLTNRIITAGGRRMDQSVKLKMKSK
jgi:hypothetical protein